jgi:hypothetical protein
MLLMKKSKIEKAIFFAIFFPPEHEKSKEDFSKKQEESLQEHTDEFNKEISELLIY